MDSQKEGKRKFSEKDANMAEVKDTWRAGCVRLIDALAQPASRLHLFSVTALSKVWGSVGL